MENTSFQTQEIALAASIVVTLQQLPDIQSQSANGKAIFYFQRSSELDELLRLYYTSQLRVEPKSLVIAVRNLKDAAMRYRNESN